LPNLPAAALTARGTVNGAATLGLKAYNTAPETAGIAIRARGSVDTTGLLLVTAPGTPNAAALLQNDAHLPARPEVGATNPDRLFPSIFNMWPESYRRQPAAVPLACGDAACTTSAVRAAAALNPGRVLWLSAGLTLNSTDSIGSATEPVVLVVNGNLSASAASTIYGLVYVRTADWTMEGNTRVQGAVIAEGNVGGTGASEFVFDAALLRQLHAANGSFVRVPGSWKDF
jgi:hypothetical protein